MSVMPGRWKTCTSTGLATLGNRAGHSLRGQILLICSPAPVARHPQFGEPCRPSLELLRGSHRAPGHASFTRFQWASTHSLLAALNCDQAHHVRLTGRQPATGSVDGRSVAFVSDRVREVAKSVRMISPGAGRLIGRLPAQTSEPRSERPIIIHHTEGPPRRCTEMRSQGPALWDERRQKAPHPAPWRSITMKRKGSTPKRESGGTRERPCQAYKVCCIPAGEV